MNEMEIDPNFPIKLKARLKFAWGPQMQRIRSFKTVLFVSAAAQTYSTMNTILTFTNGLLDDENRAVV